jgi:hypothetical protein
MDGTRNAKKKANARGARITTHFRGVEKSGV